MNAKRQHVERLTKRVLQAKKGALKKLCKQLDGAKVLFDTGTGAKKYMNDVQGVMIEEAGDGPDGFARYRISL